MTEKRVVHIVGMGTIGEPLVGLFSHFKDPLGIDEVTFYKRTPRLEDRPKVLDIIERGAKLSTDDDCIKDFEQLGIQVTYGWEEALDAASVIIECTPKGVAMKHKAEIFPRLEKNTLGFIAQGSEFGFGKMYARGINDRALDSNEDRYVQVVSCNTHNISAVVDTLSRIEEDYNMVEGRFVCMRRANDLSQDYDYVPAPQVGSHNDPKFGTHHARDAYHLFKTLNFDLNMFSSAIVLNTQYMHTLWFDIKLRDPISLQQVRQRFADNSRVAMTERSLASQVFSFGRDHGFFGRILNQTVVVAPSLAVNDGHEVVGFCFTPQDGNALLSSVAATLWWLYPDQYVERLQCLRRYFFNEV